MKKIISILLAVATLVFSTNVLADKGATVDDSRNSETTLPIEKSNMPCFRGGDTITISATGLVNGDELTVISYKVDETPADRTVQYVNQYVLSGDSQAITYKIRNIEPGVYCLDITDTDGTVPFYYTIGVTAEIVPNTNGANNDFAYIAYQPGGAGTPWHIGFVAKIKIYCDGGAIPDEEDIIPGISISNGTKSVIRQKAEAITLSNGAYEGDYEFEGEATYMYGVTVYNVTDGSEGTLTAEALTE